MKHLMFALFGLFILNFSAFGDEADAIEKRLLSQSKSKEDHFSKLTSLLSLGRDLNEYTTTFHHNILRDVEEGKVLHGQQLTILHKLVACYLSLNYQLEKISSQTNKLSISLLANLEQLNNFSLSYADYYKNKKFRRLIEAEDASYDVTRKEIRKNIRSIVSKENIRKINGQIIEFQKYLADNSPDSDNGLAGDIIEHPAFEMVQDQKRFKELRLKYFGQKISDFGARVSQQFVHHLSGVVGNGAGSVRWRKGHLLNDQELLKEISKILKPLDVITEKTWFALTDSLIPGHFGHNAIWLGTKEQLQGVGMWEHPSIKSIHKFIEEGKTIIETDRSGTHLKGLEEFMNVDEFAILRLNGGAFTEERMKDIYKVAIAQLEKTYDFNFDVETTDKLVCSELLYQSFGDINWPTEHYLGRTTISPDNVVSLALFQKSPFELIYYVAERHKGERVYKDLDNLAVDIGFIKRDNVYMKPVTRCHYEEVDRPSNRSMRTGSRVRETVTVKKCNTVYTELQYFAHDWIPDFH